MLLVLKLLLLVLVRLVVLRVLKLLRVVLCLVKLVRKLLLVLELLRVVRCLVMLMRKLLLVLKLLRVLKLRKLQLVRKLLLILLSGCSGTTACKISYEVLHLLQNQASIVENGVVGGMARGQLLVGNSGDKIARAFNLLGPAVNISWKLADIATQYCAPKTSELLIYGPLFKDVEIEFGALPVGKLDLHKKFPWLKTPVATTVHLIMSTRQAKTEDEWMYQVAQLESSVGKDSLLAPILNSIFDSNIDEEVFEAHRAALLAASTSMSKPAVADLLTKSYDDFVDACSYTL
ncbi:hypothetical protein DIPPA_17735 [Diplonema papillatum]|nr:hypothetical protein DIPPA_17735 [Diplonema papillatum]KAJ9469316.1 hypothetical protein DIPPA_17735 [Diplonema papillatum]KAJ9469317.1 hypothetical protein DIPPA_17735 [Diplonema papillatum]